MDDIPEIRMIPCVVLKEIGYHDIHQVGEIINVDENHVSEGIKEGWIKVNDSSKDKSFTITRRIDDLGRIQIPKNIRKLLNIEEGEELEISVNTYYQEITIKKINI